MPLLNLLMLRLLPLVSATLLFISLSFADFYEISWNANTESDLAGYKVYWGSESGSYTNYTNVVDVGNVILHEFDIPVGTYVAVTAYDNEEPVNESGFSLEVVALGNGGIAPATNIQSSWKEIIELADNGFVTVRPTSFGDTVAYPSGNHSYLQKFVCPGTGAVELSEIGFLAYVTESPVNAKLGVFTHDAVNDCPDNLILEVDITVSDLSSAVQYRMCTEILTGGETYWVGFHLESGLRYLRQSTGGNSISDYGPYPDWTLGWVAHVDQTWGLPVYVIYEAQ